MQNKGFANSDRYQFKVKALPEKSSYFVFGQDSVQNVTFDTTSVQKFSANDFAKLGSDFETRQEPKQKVQDDWLEFGSPNVLPYYKALNAIYPNFTIRNFGQFFATNDGTKSAPQEEVVNNINFTKQKMQDNTDTYAKEPVSIFGGSHLTSFKDLQFSVLKEKQLLAISGQDDLKQSVLSFKSADAGQSSYEQFAHAFTQQWFSADVDLTNITPNLNKDAEATFTVNTKD